MLLDVLGAPGELEKIGWACYTLLVQSLGVVLTSSTVSAPTMNEVGKEGKTLYICKEVMYVESVLCFSIIV